MLKENVIPLAKNLIKSLEALKLVAYLDGAGNASIGFGATTIDGRRVTMRDRCTEAQAEMWLTNRIEDDYTKLDLFCHVHGINIEDNEAAVILRFSYNAGFAAFVGSSMARDLSLNRVDKVSSDLLKWNKIRVDGTLTFSPGLFNRRMEESQCFVDKGKC